MVRLIVDDSMSQQLNQFNTPVDLCDVSGRVLGQFVPSGEISYEQAIADGYPYGPEELKRAQREEGGTSLAEIWRELGQR